MNPPGDLYFSRGHTTTVFYNEVALGRWLERTVRDLGIQVVTGAVLGDVVLRDGFVSAVDLATRYGDVRVRAAGYVDASGDAALTWQAGLPCWVPSRPIYGSQQVIVENLDEAHKPEPGRSTRCSPPGARSPGCCGAAASPSSSPGAAPRC